MNFFLKEILLQCYTYLGSMYCNADLIYVFRFNVLQRRRHSLIVNNIEHLHGRKSSK